MRIGNSLAEVRRRGGLARGVIGNSGILLGPELILNGDPITSSGWIVTGADATHIVTFSGGVLRFQSDTTSPTLTVSQSVLTAGKKYQVSVNCSAYTSGSIKSDAFASQSFLIANSIGMKTFQGIALNSSFNFTRNSLNVDLGLNKISVREILN